MKFFDTGVLNSRTDLKIRFKLFSMYFDIEKKAGGSHGLKEPVEKHRITKNLASLLFSLGVIEVIFDTSVRASEI